MDVVWLLIRVKLTLSVGRKIKPRFLESAPELADRPERRVVAGPDSVTWAVADQLAITNLECRSISAASTRGRRNSRRNLQLDLAGSAERPPAR